MLPDVASTLQKDSLSSKKDGDEEMKEEGKGGEHMVIDE